MDQAKIAAHNMVEQQLRQRGVRDPHVLAAMEQVPRHHFVPDIPIEQAYADHALPTACGQTISQPYIVARMTELLQVRPGHKVLEVGTGSGYQAAVLARIGARVVTIERFEDLAQRARHTLQQIAPGMPIHVVVGDGSLGWPEQAPYDRIIVTAAAPTLPEPCRQQLADHGRIVIPIGDRHAQTLTVFTRHGEQWLEEADLPCRFVPLVGQAAWKHGENT